MYVSYADNNGQVFDIEISTYWTRVKYLLYSIDFHAIGRFVRKRNKQNKSAQNRKHHSDLLNFRYFIIIITVRTPLIEN